MGGVLCTLNRRKKLRHNVARGGSRRHVTARSQLQMQWVGGQYPCLQLSLHHSLMMSSSAHSHAPLHPVLVSGEADVAAVVVDVLETVFLLYLLLAFVFVTVDAA